MPLAFESLSHGKIAFGFFNIETDMILLNDYFLFAEDFCRYISEAVEKGKDAYQAAWEVYRIESENIGNLMGAIHGTDLGGFIGEVYKIFPFPERMENFKQNPEGFRTRSLIEEMIKTYGKQMTIPFVANLKDDKITIGGYVFRRPSFRSLIQYIWVGGMPRWKDEIRPPYVMMMKKKIEASENSLFEGLLLS
jgi:hypothetical protein